MGFGEQRWRVDVGVAVNLAVAEECRVFEAGDEFQDTILFAELQVILEADEVGGEAVAARRFSWRSCTTA